MCCLTAAIVPIIRSEGRRIASEETWVACKGPVVVVVAPSSLLTPFDQTSGVNQVKGQTERNNVSGSITDACVMRIAAQDMILIRGADDVCVTQLVRRFI